MYNLTGTSAWQILGENQLDWLGGQKSIRDLFTRRRWSIHLPSYSNQDLNYLNPRGSELAGIGNGISKFAVYNTQGQASYVDIPEMDLEETSYFHTLGAVYSRNHGLYKM